VGESIVCDAFLGSIDAFSATTFTVTYTYLEDGIPYSGSPSGFLTVDGGTPVEKAIEIVKSTAYCATGATGSTGATGVTGVTGATGVTEPCCIANGMGSTVDVVIADSADTNINGTWTLTYGVGGAFTLNQTIGGTDYQFVVSISNSTEIPCCITNVGVTVEGGGWSFYWSDQNGTPEGCQPILTTSNVVVNNNPQVALGNGTATVICNNNVASCCAEGIVGRSLGLTISGSSVAGINGSWSVPFDNTAPNFFKGMILGYDLYIQSNTANGACEISSVAVNPNGNPTPVFTWSPATGTPLGNQEIGLTTDATVYDDNGDGMAVVSCTPPS
jgi:hypothetical protein